MSRFIFVLAIGRETEIVDNEIRMVELVGFNCAYNGCVEELSQADGV